MLEFPSCSEPSGADKLLCMNPKENFVRAALIYKLSFLFISFLLWQSAFAQDYARWGLPEGAIARLGKGTISDFAYSPDGARLAVGSSIGIWLYDARTGAEIALFTGHTGILNCVAFSPDGRTLAGGSADGTVHYVECGHRKTYGDP